MKHHNFIICNGDTDSIAFKKPDEKPFTPEERAALLAELNALMPENIVWADDDFFRRFIVCGAKNYILDNGKKVKLKGNSLKATKKEPALREFIREVVDLLLKDKKEQVIFAYLRKAQEISRITDISPWCFKATVTKKVLEPSTVFNRKIRDAIGARPVAEGDKVYLFYMEDGTLCLREDFKGEFDRMKLLGKLRDTIETFGKVFDVELFPDLTLSRNKELLAELGLSAKNPPVATVAVKPLTSEENIEACAKEVTTWPKWKVEAIKGTLSEPTINPPTGVKLVRV